VQASIIFASHHHRAVQAFLFGFHMPGADSGDESKSVKGVGGKFAALPSPLLSFFIRCTSLATRSGRTL